MKLTQHLTLLGLCLSLSAGAAPKPKDHAAHHPPKKEAPATPKGSACMGMMSEMMGKMSTMMQGKGMGMGMGMNMMGETSMQDMMNKHMSLMGDMGEGEGKGMGMMKMTQKDQVVCAQAKTAMEACWKKGGQSCGEAAKFLSQRHSKMENQMKSQMQSLHPRDPKRQKLWSQLKMMHSMQEMMEKQILKKQ